MSGKLNYIVWKEGKYFVAQCINVDVSSFGDTKEGAINNLEEALQLYFEDNKSSYINDVQQPEIVQSSFTYA